MLQGIVVQSLVDVLIQQQLFIDGCPPNRNLSGSVVPSQTTPLKVAKKQRLGSPGLAPKSLDFDGAALQQKESQQVHEVGLVVI